jgi:DNA-binding HxlR family transcriptional regulator
VAATLPLHAQPTCTCVVGGLIDLVGKKWTMCIIVTLGNQPGIRFNGLLATLGPISPRTLSDTLKSLEREGLVQRQAFAEIPPRVEYRLSLDGARLREAIRPLMEYAAAKPGAECAPTQPVAGGGPESRSHS